MAAPLTDSAVRLSEAIAALGEAVAALRPFGPWGGLLVAAAGAAGLTVGARRTRVLALWGGAAVGALAALVLHRLLETHFGLVTPVAAWAGAAAGAALCGLYPPAFPLAAGALPGALIGAEVSPGGSTFGAGAGALVGGLAGMAAARLVTAGFSSFAGGVLAAVGLSAMLASHPLGRELAGRPFALAGVALVLGIAGTAFQAGRGAAPAPPRPREPAAPDDPLIEET